MNMFVRKDDAQAPAFVGTGPALDVAAALRKTLTPQSLLRHWMLGCAIVAGLLVLGGVYLLTRTIIYTSTTSVLVTGSLNPENQRLSISSYADMQDWAAKIQQLAADKSRLEAEAHGKASISFPDELTTAASIPALKRVMDSASLLFEARRRAAADAGRVLAQSLQLYKDEVSSLTKQVEYATMQQQSIDQELQSVRSLADKRLAVMSRQGDVERTAAVLASRKIEVETELLDRRQKIVETEQRIADIEANRRTEALSKLQDINSDMRTARARLEQAKTTSALISTSSSPDPTSVENQAEIIRSDATALKVIELASLYKDRGFLLANAPNQDMEDSEDARRRLALYVLQRGVSVERAGRASRLDISFASTSPDWAAKITNAYATAYLGSDASQQEIGIKDDRTPEPAAPQILRGATVKQESPGAANVLIAMIFVGLVIGPGVAFGLEFMRHLRVAR